MSIQSLLRGMKNRPVQGTGIILQELTNKRGSPSQIHDGHEERMLAHSQRVRIEMHRQGVWTELQDRMFELEQKGDLKTMRTLLHR